jgi:hypothetical protein
MRSAILMIVVGILLACPLRTVSSQETEPKGFLGIEWGESVESARAKLLRRSGVVMDTIMLDATHRRLLLSMGEFLDEPVDTWNLEFINNKFFWVKIILDSQNFAGIESILRMRYGDPSVSSVNRLEWEFPDAAVRFAANTPPGHTGIVLWNKRLYQMKSQQSEKQDKEKRFNMLRELD